MLDEIDNNFQSFGRSSKSSTEESYGIHRGQGGVALFWRKDMSGTSRIDTVRHDRICGIRIPREDGSAFAILSVYLPASGSNDSLTVTLDELEGILESLGEDTIPIICGDFNGNMDKLGGDRGSGDATKAGRSVKTFMDNQGMCAANMLQLASGSTFTFECHNGRSTIDYVMIQVWSTITK